MKVTQISSREARRMAVGAQGLHKRSPFGRGKNGVLQAIRQVGYFQIDTISVVERAHHHAIWSRVPNYRKKHVLKLQKDEKKILEHWSHALSYLPMEDFRYTLPVKRYFREHRDPWPKADPGIKAYVLERVKKEGPLKARDFKAMRKRKGDGWWDWKPAKLALERLFFEGTLMVTHREGFQKVYDIPDRVLPAGLDKTEPDTGEYAQFLIHRSIRSHGFCSIGSMAYLRPGMSRAIREELSHLVEAGKVIPARIKGIDVDYYTTQENLENIPRVQKQIRFLSPFDNLVIQRKRVLNVFDFDFQIECYMPREKRKYGYFSLPILFGTKMIGRSDMKTDRQRKAVHINNLVFEGNVQLTDRLLSAFENSIRAFADFQEAEKINLHTCHPASAKSMLLDAIPSFS